MSGCKLRWLGLGLVTTAGAGVMALTAIVNSAFAYGDPADSAATDPTSTIGLVMGGSGAPLPNYNIPGYVGLANQLYIEPNFPDTTYPGPYADGLFTPEYPVFSMPMSLNYPTATTGPLDGFPALSTSMGQGMLALENAIATNQAAGDISTVFGWSQSSTISSLVMEQLDPTGTPAPNDDLLQFVLVGDPSAPNGGLFERFDGLNLPSLGLLFDGATPADDFPTDIYTLEYDGYADFPRYPIDFLSDLNALLGMIDIHGLYLSLSTEQVDTATLLPGSALSPWDTPDSLTNYYMIDEAPPLVSLLPKQLQELLGPDLTYLINLGYGDGSLGYSVTPDSPANVPTPFGLFPDVSPSTVLSTLVTDTEQGITNLMSGTGSSSAALDPASSGASMTDLMSALTADAADPSATLTGIANGISSAGESLSTVQMQTQDLVNALVTQVPAYDASLFLANLNNPLDAVGLPLAADTALITLAAGFEYQFVDQAITAIISDLTF